MLKAVITIQEQVLIAHRPSTLLLLLLAFISLAAAQFDIFPGQVNMTANFTYHPTALIEAFHSMPHFGKDGSVVKHPEYKAGNTPATHKEAQEYYNSLLPVPIFLFILSLLAIVALELGINDCCTWLVPKLGQHALGNHWDLHKLIRFFNPIGPKEIEEDTITAIAFSTHQHEV